MATRDWRVDFLRGAGFPVTAANLAFLTSWQAHESGGSSSSALASRAGSNPFNIAYESLPPEYRARARIAYTSSNGTHIAAFPNEATGGAAWASYLARSGYYSNVIRGLKAGNPFNATLRQGILGDLSTWVSGSRSSNLGYGASILAGHGISFSQAEGIAKTAPGAKIGGPFGSQISQASGAVTGAIDVIKTPAEAIKWLWSNWDRAAEVLGGFLLIIVGLVLMGRSLGVTKTKVEVVQRALPGAGEREAQDRAAAAEQRAYERAAASAGRARARSEAGEEPRARRRSVALAADEPRKAPAGAGSSQLGPDEELPF